MQTSVNLSCPNRKIAEIAMDSESPKIEKFQDRPPGLNISSEIESFKRAAHQTLLFMGNSEGQD